MKIVFMNSPICTAEGTYKLSKVSLPEATRIVSSASEIDSAVGHSATANLLTSIFKVKVPLNRVTYIQPAGVVAIVMKLKSRPPEGKILSKEEMEKIGYDFYKMERS